MLVDFNHILKDFTIPDHTLLDYPNRLKANPSFWNTYFLSPEQRNLNCNINEKVINFFQERYNIDDPLIFQTIWNNLGSRIWTVKEPLTAGVIRNIDHNFRKNLIFHGKGIAKPKFVFSESDEKVQNFVNLLFHGKIFDKDMAMQSLFSSNDKDFPKQFFHQLECELFNLAAHPPKTEQDELVWRAFLGSVIASFPYCNLITGETVKIPFYDQGICRIVDYHIEFIPLIHSELSSPMAALGLTPIKHFNAPPILIYSGTTPPGSEGHATTLIADFTPGKSVGEIIYKYNKEKISTWLSDKNNVHLIGSSLGGALSLHTLRHHHQVARVDAYNPPGLSDENWKKGVGDTCKVNIYCQSGDIVSKIGTWPSNHNVSLYTVFQHQGLYQNPLSSHVRIFTGCKKISIIKINPELTNQDLDRRILTQLHKLSTPFIYCTLMSSLLFYKFTYTVHRFVFTCLEEIHKTFKPRA